MQSQVFILCEYCASHKGHANKQTIFNSPAMQKHLACLFTHIAC